MALVASLNARQKLIGPLVVPPLVFVAFLGWYAVPELGPRKSLRQMWERYVELRAEGEPITQFGSAKDSGFYYSNLEILRTKKISELSEYLDQPGARFMILRKNDYRKLPRRHLPRGEWNELLREHSSQMLVVFRRD